MRRMRRIRPSDVIEKPRKSTFNLGPRVPPPSDHQAFRTAILVALADAKEPVTAGQLWARMGGKDKSPLELQAVLAVLVIKGLVEDHERIGGWLYELTAKGTPLIA